MCALADIEDTLAVIPYSVCPCRYGGYCGYYTIVYVLADMEDTVAVYHTVYALADMEDTSCYAIKCMPL